jgi:beta-phosphoglucomutase
MTSVNAVIWDMDGVLVDTGYFHYQAWLSTLHDYKVDFSWDYFCKTFGMNNAGLIEDLLGYLLSPKIISEIADKKEARFRDMIIGRISLIPDVHEWLEFFKRSGYLQAVASSAPQKNIDQILEELEVRHYFSIVLSAENMPGKPDPAVFLEAARCMDIEPKTCLVIEDAISGVTAAKKAGMFCLAVTNTHAKEFLTGADYIVEKLDKYEIHNIFSLFDHSG